MSQVNQLLYDLSKHVDAVKKWAVFTSSVRDSVRREGPDGAAHDEGIALAISEERGAADGPSQPTE